MYTETITTLKDKVDFFLIVYCFLMLCINILEGFSSLYIGILINLFVLGLWYRYCSWKDFCITYDKISRWYGERSGLPVRYGYKSIEGNVIEKVYIESEDTWYECDMDYFFPDGLTLGRYESFIASNDTYGKLCQTLRLNKTDIKIYRRYQCKESDYLTLKWGGLFFLVIFSILYWYYYISWIY